MGVGSKKVMSHARSNEDQDQEPAQTPLGFDPVGLRSSVCARLASWAFQRGSMSIFTESCEILMILGLGMLAASVGINIVLE